MKNRITASSISESLIVVAVTSILKRAKAV